MCPLPSLAGLFVTSFVVAFSGALMPGPLLTFTIAETGRRGAWAGPLLMCGHATLEMAMVALLILGVAPFLKLPVVSGAIGLAGGAILLWLAAGMFRSLPTLRAEGFRTGLCGPAGGSSAWFRAVAHGIVMSLANPYWTIWWATIGLGYMSVAVKYGAPGLAAFFVGHILADFVWYSAVSVGLSAGGRFLSDRMYRGMVAVCGLALVVFGVWFGRHGLSTLGVLP